VTDKLWHRNADKLQHASTFPARGDDAGREPVSFTLSAKLFGVAV